MNFSVDPYLGRAYDRRRYHCWHLVEEVWFALTGEQLGPVPDYRHEGRIFERFPEVRRVDRPVTPCVALFLRPSAVPHAGVFLKGRVLHIRQEGARYDRLETVSLGFAEVRFYAALDANHQSARTPDVGAARDRGRARSADEALSRVAT